MTTKAVVGMTPYEAAFGKKPNLSGLRKWGEKTYVRIEGGTKLGGRVREGCWLGVDEQLKGVQIYWPDTKSITVERNVYYDDTSASRCEGEKDIIVTKTNLPNYNKTPEVQPNPTVVEDEIPEDEISNSCV
jgi:hypothetical protein